MSVREFGRAGHSPTLLSAFLYFDISFMVWVILGPLAPFIGEAYKLSAAQKGLLTAVPLLGGSFFRPILGSLTERIGGRKTDSPFQIRHGALFFRPLRRGQILRRKAVAPPIEARSDLQIIAALAERLGYGRKFPSTPGDVFEELRRASAGGSSDYAGITYDRIKAEDGVFWPCPDEQHTGTSRLFAESFPTPNGRARFHPVEFPAAMEEPDAEYPLYLTTGRVLSHYQSGTQTRRVEKLNSAVPEAFVEIHPAMARSYGIAQDNQVSLTTRRGTATAKARLTSGIRMDTVFLPFHFASNGRANLLTNPALDPVSRMPEFKVCAVRIAKAL